MPIVDLEILSDQTIGEGGFLAIRRLHVRNLHDDGTRSRTYLVDYLTRPKGIDAVVVALWHRTASGNVDVLVRDGLRPPLTVGRDAARIPLPDRRRYLFFTELVAGIIEQGEVGEAAVRARAAAEVMEEAGYAISPEEIVLLGEGTFPSPGAMSEKFHLCAVEVRDPKSVHEIHGDGSPYEEGATTRWLDLQAAIDSCVAGVIEDCKTEITLRRLRDWLARR